jgi:hypothetical protein
MAGVLDIELAAEGIDAALRVDHGHLPHLALGVGGEQALERLGRGHASAHQFEALVAVRRVHERLCRHRAHTGFRPRDNRADREPVGLDGDAHLPGRGIARDDGKRVRQRARLASGTPEPVSVAGSNRILSPPLPAVADL